MGLSMKIGSTYQPVLKWEETEPQKSDYWKFDKMKSSIMSFQLMMTKEGGPLLTGLRLCYYGNNKKPRVWIRSPMSPRRASSNLRDFVPIYSDVSHASSLDGVFAIKKTEARLMSVVD